MSAAAKNICSVITAPEKREIYAFYLVFDFIMTPPNVALIRRNTIPQRRRRAYLDTVFYPRQSIAQILNISSPAKSPFVPNERTKHEHKSCPDPELNKRPNTQVG